MSAGAPPAGACKNCARFSPTPFKHSFCAALDQCKNQSFATPNAGWIVTPTSRTSETLTDAIFCSGDCLFSYLFTHELLSNKAPDTSLHFFKRSDEQRQWVSQQLTSLEDGGEDAAKVPPA